jgi:2-polyprenyl-6-methoxyphenol hydroxylase-like FAD-dependent oxidoreductase
VFLGGDSAHIHSPAGAQGMNTGMEVGDGYERAGQAEIHHVLQVFAPYCKPDLLETYNRVVDDRKPLAFLVIFLSPSFTVRG